MTDQPKPTREELEQARNLGAATYINAYIRLMADHLGVEIGSQDEISGAARLFVDPMNQAMTFCWGLFVNDRSTSERALAELKEILDAELPRPPARPA